MAMDASATLERLNTWINAYLDAQGGNQFFRTSPFADITKTFTYNNDGTISQIVMVGAGQTVTLIFTYDSGKVVSIVPIITP
jgi:hypothetical protein